MKVADQAATGARRVPFVQLRTLAVFGLPILTALGWGGSFPIAKAALPSVNAFYLSSERYVVASLVFAAVLWAVEGRRAFSFDGHFRKILVLGATGFGGFNLLAFVGLAHTRPQNAALFVATMPLLTALVLWIRRGVAPSRATMGFMLAALIGVGLVVTRGSISLVTSGRVGAGDAMVLSGVLCWVIYMLGASSFPEWSPLRYTTLSALAGTLAIVTATAVATAVGYVSAPSLHQTLMTSPHIVYLAVPGAAVAVLVWNASIKRIGLQNTVLFINLVPVTTLVIEIARGYRVTEIELAGVVVTIAAVAANNVWQRRAALRVAPAPQHKVA